MTTIKNQAQSVTTKPIQPVAGELPDTPINAHEVVLANLEDQPIETDETDKADLSTVTNTDFLSNLFGLPERDSHPIICGFRGNPNDGSGGKWFGQPWFPGTTATDDSDKNWYFSLASYTPNNEGQYRRQKKQLAALHVIMLDDVGTKSSGRDRLDSLPPSWLIETSEGNYQAGYIFVEPLTDGAIAESLVEATIAAGLCDPGANGPLARYARLPVGVNGKHTPPFPCRLTEWHPERRYTVEQIVTGLELALGEPKRTQRTNRAAANNNVAEDGVYTPRAAENVVIATLRERGLYKSPLGSDKHDLTCPWVHEHTDEVDGGTAYFEPSDSYPIGGFKCLHGHCAERRISTLLDHLGITYQAAKHKPTIRVAPGEINRIVDAAEQELSLTGRHYQRGGLIVSVVTDPGTLEISVKALSPLSLVRVLSGIAIWERHDARADNYVLTDPPARHAGVLFDSEQYPHMPVLNGIARQPYLRPDGSLMIHAGYDKTTGMYGVFNEREFDVPAAPSREEAEAALSEISTLLEEFGFATEQDRAAVLAGILTAAIRPSLPQAPMFHIKAPQIASGKSYLSALISAFATPMAASALSFPQDDEECRKLLLSTLLTAPAVLCFDNLTTDLIPHKSLCSTLTEEFITGRILGVSKTATVGTRALFLSSGNNVDAVRDMTRRCITIRLDPGCEVPAAREFNQTPVVDVRNNRGHFVSLALAIIRAWITANRPITSCKPLASFEDWTALVRQPLLWLGLPDPASSVFDCMADDPDTETLGRVLYEWKNAFGSAPKMVRDVVQATLRSPSEENAEFREVISDIAADKQGQIDRGRLGWWIRRHQGRIVGGLKFEKVSGGRNASQWRVVSVSSVSSDHVRPNTTSVSDAIPGEA